MTLGLPYDFFARELLVVLAYATAAVLCGMRWQQGRWAQVGASAALIGATVRAFWLLSWVLYSNDVDFLMELRRSDVVQNVLGWLEVLALVAVLVAIVLGRDARAERRAT